MTWATRKKPSAAACSTSIRFKTADGHDVEVFYGPRIGGATSCSKKGGTSFVAGNQGLGHFVLAAKKPAGDDGVLHHDAAH